MTLRPSATFHLHRETATTGGESQPWFATEASIISALSTIPRLTAFATSLSTVVKASARSSRWTFPSSTKRLPVAASLYAPQGSSRVRDSLSMEARLRENSGQEREIRLKTNGLDPVPKVQIGGQAIELARPLAWYEYVWMGIPIALVFVGGGLGALFGLAAVYSSARIFRSDRGTASKYGLSALISLGAALAFFVAALVVQLLIGPRAKT